ncbi:MAG: CCA tRNA nucleotidyltransferase, partial [Okeania sp. SIO2D1]|nr:CCA tRNA nucleotidyltransferase [Okeania sp. SIO2D1]
VVLDERRQIARVVFPHQTLDFAQQEGDSLEADLRRRDFTINAIAYNLHQDSLVDPLGGVKDLAQSSLTMISEQNLRDDPLRLLRAYRQAAQLNFAIEEQTRDTISSLAHLITEVAAERVQTELNYLLAGSDNQKWLKLAYQDNLLSLWLPSVTLAKLNLLGNVEPAAKLICVSSQAELSLAKLACLVSAVPTEAREQLINLKYSRAVINTVTKALEYLPQLLAIETSPLSLKEQYFFFQGVGEVFPTLAILAVASGVKQAEIAPLITAYLNPDDQKAHPTPLLTGKEIMEYLNLPPSPKIGKLLTEIQLARIEGKITNREEALRYIQLTSPK